MKDYIRFRAQIMAQLAPFATTIKITRGSKGNELREINCDFGLLRRMADTLINEAEIDAPAKRMVLSHDLD